MRLVVALLSLAVLHSSASAAPAKSHDSDVPKLLRAFAKLDAGGILARHEYGATRSDGYSSISREAAILRARGTTPVGYVYYTMQDAESLGTGQLHLAWGAFGQRPNDTYRRIEERAAAVAEKITRALRAEGLTVRWDGGAHGTIEVVGLKWKTAGQPPIPRGERVEGVVPPEKPMKPTSPYPLTDAEEWLVRIVYLSGTHANAAASLHALRALMDRERFDAGPGPPNTVEAEHVYSLDFVSRLLGRVADKPVRFDCIATSVSPSLASTWRDLVRLADGVMIVATDPDDAKDLLDLVRREAEHVPVTFQADGDAWDEAKRAALAQRTQTEVTRTDVYKDAQHAMDAFRPIAKLVLTRLKRALESGAR